MATYPLTSFHHSHLTRQDAFQVECFFLERMVLPICGVCSGSVVPLACGIFCQVGPPGGELSAPPSRLARGHSPGKMLLLERTVRRMCSRVPGSAVPLSCDVVRPVGPGGGSQPAAVTGQ